MSLTGLLAAENRKKLIVSTSALVLVSLVALGAMAKNGWLPSTDPLTGQKTGWFGSKSSPPYEGGVAASRGRGGSLDPAPPPSATPQLSREYLYAGQKLLAVEDANANAAPPADLAVWRPSTGQWWVLGGPGSAQTNASWGQAGDIPVPGDYDGDGKTDFSIFRPSNYQWYIIFSSNNVISNYEFGAVGDKPAQADYDGDGRTDAAVFRPSNNNWYVLGTTNGFYYSTWGDSGDIPVSADYDGDGRADISVWRGSNKTFYSVNSSNGNIQTITFTQSSTQPVCGDYDGDGKADFAVRSGNTWTIRKSSNTQIDTITPTWEQAADTPVPNDYDGDGNWYIRQSATNGSLRQQAWGQSGDIPVPALYRR